MGYYETGNVGSASISVGGRVSADNPIGEPRVLTDAVERTRERAARAHDLGGQFEHLADRIFGLAPSQPSPPEAPKSDSVSLVTQMLDADADLRNGLNRISNVLDRLRAVA